jgi:hypothetical protein
MVHRQWYAEKAPPDPRFAQLGDFNRWIKICLESEIHIIQKVLVKFRIRAGEANASAGTPEKIRRSLFEYRQLLEHFLTITDLADLVAIFPEIQKFGKPLQPDLIPFYIAQMALTFPTPVHEDFALKTLFNFLSDPEKRSKVTESELFTFSEFLRLTGNIEPWRDSHDSFVFPPLYRPPQKVGLPEKFRKFFFRNQ